VGVQILKKYGKCIVIFSISAIVTALILFAIFYKPPLKNACIDDLKDIDGIGVYNAGAIVEYITYNQDATPEDLDIIDGIDEKTIEKVKEKYK
jgi:DNA integrity scanning protein DisA with diadenylate cyclase activity